MNMKLKSTRVNYRPGIYAKSRPDAALVAGQYIRAWSKKQPEAEKEKAEYDTIAPAICFSRKIGVGALEIADILAEKMDCRVADRLIIEQIISNSKLSEKTVKFFDERYPGKMNELAAFFFGEKSFVMRSYMQQLCSAVFVLARAVPTIFVGRGTHLILPRDKVLAVRCISSREFRIKRLASILNVPEEIAAKKLDEADREQREYFKKAFNRKDAPQDEFDLIINCDFISSPDWAAKIVRQAYITKFADLVKSKGG